MSKKPASPKAEWSVMVKSDDVISAGKTYEISPDEAQLKSLAKRFDVKEIESLNAKITLRRENAHIVYAQGTVNASIKQNCVVTLEPVETHISDEFEAWYADESQAVSFKRAQREAESKKDLLDVPMLDESEDPEPMVNGQIDIADLASQYFSLAIPAYPTKEGITYSVQVEEPKEAKNNMKLNPFAALKNWRPKD